MQTDPSEREGNQQPLAPAWLSWLGAVGWRILATVGLAVVVLWLAFILSTTTASVLLAGIVAATFAPYVMALRNRGWGRAKAAGVVTLVAVLIILAIAVLIVLAFVPQISAVVTGLQAGLAQLQTSAADYSLPPEYTAMVANVTSNIQAWLSTELAALVSTGAIIVTVSILAGLLTFYLLSDGDKALAWAVPDTMGWRRAPIREAAVDAMQRVGGYLRGSAILGVVYGVTDFVFLVLIGLGIPLAAPLSVLVFVGSFIPYIGGILTTAVLLLVTLGTLGSQAAIVLFLMMFVRNVIVSNLLRPVVYGKTVDLHPAVILMVLPAGFALAGVFGLFVAIPLAACFASISGALASVLDDREPDLRQPGDQDADPAVPVWLDRLGQWSVRLLIVAAVGGVAIAIAGAVPIVIATVTFGVVLAASFRPAALALQRRGWGTGRAALVVTGTGWGLTLLIIVISIAALVANADQLVSSGTAGASSISGAELIKTLAGQAGSWFKDTLSAVVQGLTDIAVTMLLAALLTFYLLRDGPHGWASVTRRTSGWRSETIDAAGQRAVDLLGGYMISTGALSAFGAISTAIIMAILGLPLILPIAALSFILGFIPYIGGAIGTLLALLVAIADGTTQDVAVMVVWVLVFNIVQGSFLAPVVYGKAVSLHPAIVLVSIPAGMALGGIMGMFLAVPILGVIAAVWRSLVAVMSDRERALALGVESGTPGSGPPGSSLPGPEVAPQPEPDGAPPTELAGDIGLA